MGGGRRISDRRAEVCIRASVAVSAWPDESMICNHLLRHAPGVDIATRFSQLSADDVHSEYYRVFSKIVILSAAASNDRL